jgi:hypothetical protein
MYRKRFEDVEERLRRLENGERSSKLMFSMGYVLLVAILSAAIASMSTYYVSTKTKTKTTSSLPHRGSDLMLNLGSGSKRLPGYVNVDKSDMFDPDIVWDLETFPWPFRNDSVSKILMSHVLEHVGSDPNLFLRIIQELHRICRNGAIIHVIVPHPYHSDFIADPTHVRAVSFDLLLKFSKRSNRDWIAKSKADTPFALLLDVDFDFENFSLVLDHYYVGMAIERDILTLKEANNLTLVYELSKIHGNLVKQISMDMIVRK